MVLKERGTLDLVISRRYAVRPVGDGWIVEDRRGVRLWPSGRDVEADYVSAVEQAASVEDRRDVARAERQSARLIKELEKTDGIVAIEVDETDDQTGEVIKRKKWKMRGDADRHAKATIREALKAAREAKNGKSRA